MFTDAANNTIEYRVCRADELADRGRLLVRAGSREIGVFRINGEFRAYLNRCCHQGGPVCRGTIIGRWREQIDSGGQTASADFSTDEIDLACPWHGWEYDLRTGKNIADPSISLTSFPVEVRDGYITLLIPEDVR